MDDPSDELLARAMSTVERNDLQLREGRARRMLWVSGLPSAPGMVMGRFEQLHLVDEAKWCYIDGRNAATVMISYAVIEHSLDEIAEAFIGTRSSKKGQTSIDVCREASLLDNDLLDQADRVREVRNALGHYKPEANPHRAVNRSRDKNISPQVMLQEDAKDALKVAMSMFVATLRPAEF